MSAKNNKKESASDALLRIDMIKEASNENLKNLLAETVQNYLNEAICKEEEDKDDDKAEITEAQFGDRVYIITTKKTYVMGNDKVWYEM